MFCVSFCVHVLVDITNIISRKYFSIGVDNIFLLETIIIFQKKKPNQNYDNEYCRVNGGRPIYTPCLLSVVVVCF